MYLAELEQEIHFLETQMEKLQDECDKSAEDVIIEQKELATLEGEEEKLFEELNELEKVVYKFLIITYIQP